MHSKSFVIRWAHVQPGYVVQWQIRPLKKSVSFGVFQHQAVDDGSAAKDINMAGGSISQRLASNGFKPIENIRRIQANETSEGSTSVTSGQLIAFVIDNTFSISTAKTAQFSFTAFPVGAGPSPSPGVEEEVSAIRRRRSTLVSIDQNPEVSSDGRFISCSLLKKRRKNFQGYGRRYFTLDMKLGLLKYYLNERSSYLRGVMPLKIAEMEFDSGTREITLDSGVERWHLRALNEDGFKHWVSVLKACRSSIDEYNGDSHESSPSDVNDIDSMNSKSSLDTMGLENVLANLRTSIDNIRTQNISLDLSSLESVYKNLDRTVNSGSSGKSDANCSKTSSSSSPKKVPLVKEKTKSKKYNEKPKTNGRMTEYRQPQLLSWKEPVTGGIIGLLGLFFFSEKNLVISTVLAGILIGLLVSLKLQSPAMSFLQAPASENILSQDNSDIDGSNSSDTETVLEPQHIHFVPQRPHSHLLTSESETDNKTEKTSDEAVESDEEETAETNLYPLPHEKVARRKDVPGPKEAPPSMLSMMRRAGKDFGQFAAPVSTNEPVSALQRIAEIYESSELLDRAAKASSSRERVMMVALFSISQLATVRCKERCLRKPFTPLLGESFEMVREDRNFRFVAEKVVHKPIVIASQAESLLWTVHYTSRPLQKIWAKSIQLTDPGPIRVTFADGESVTFIGPEMFIRNILAGEKYIEAVGSIQVESSTGEIANVEFRSGGMFSGRAEEVRIVSQSDPSFIFEGTWTSEMRRIVNGEPSDVLWSVKPLIDKPNDHYGWTRFTAELNEITDLEKGHLPPNDSRLRPDIRFLECQNVEKADEVKIELEQNQRHRRKQYEDENKVWQPKYFSQSDDAQGFYALNSGKRNYWVRREANDWTNIEDIFSL